MGDRSTSTMAQGPAVLPEDILVEILRRLAAHDLAASRWVCRAWQDAVDGPHLRGHLLSRSVRGIFINYTKLTMSEFFSRPSAGPAICGGLDCLPCKGAKVTDHCNGLVLCGDWNDWQQEYVVNPATRRWARLPRRPPPHIPGFDQDARLAFDHAVSPHYQVYLIPRVPSSGYPGSNIDSALLQTEWPPASHVVHVFSSMTGRWEEKTFTREGEAAGVVADMASCRSWAEESRAVYWRGVLYAHSQCDFVIRMCLSTSKYQVIKMPQLSGLFPSSPHLGRSMRGVYYAISHSYHALRLWYLDESDGQIKWVLKHDINLDSFGRNFDLLRGQQPMDKQWILQDVNYRKCPCFEYYRRTYGDYEAPPVEEKYEWNSDNDNILDSEDKHAAGQEARWSRDIACLGFHPYKEMVFLEVSLDETVAYDWNTSQFQYLGRTSPKHYEEPQHAGIDTYFPYTPCWMYEFPVTSQLEDEQKPKPKARWRPPPDGVIKINTDACFLVNDMTGSSGLVIRDHNGALITAQALWYAHVANAPVMKALAIRDGARLARERGYQRVIIESDSKVVVDLYAKDDQSIPEISPIYREIREIGRAFSSFSITHVGREANQAAHSCAKQASADKRRCMWINYIPGFLAETLSGDCNVVN